jgi:hypothetical protein
MGEFAPLIEKLSDDRLDGLTAGDMGVLNLQDVVGLLLLVRRELEAGEGLSPDEIPTSVRNEILGGNFGNQIDALVNGMEQYGETTDNPSGQRTQFRANAEGLRDLVIERLRPILRTDEAKVQKTQAEARQMLDGLAQAQEQLAKQQTLIAQTSASEAASDLSTYYETQAKGHADTAKNFLRAGLVAGGLLAVLTVLALFVFPPDYTTTGASEPWIEVVRGTVARLAALSIVAFALAFCVRNYRVNMHLEVLNKRRENALNTFGLMQASVTSEDARNIVVGELVRAVFTSEETGYLSAQTERTVIESPGGAGMFSAMSAMTRGQAQ